MKFLRKYNENINFLYSEVSKDDYEDKLDRHGLCNFSDHELEKLTNFLHEKEYGKNISEIHKSSFSFGNSSNMVYGFNLNDNWIVISEYKLSKNTISYYVCDEVDGVISFVNDLTDSKIKGFDEFVESVKFDLAIVNVDMNESLSIWYDALLDTIDAKEVDVFDTFNLPKDDYLDKLDLEYLSDNIEFINSLSSIGLKKSHVESSDDFETFINKSCRFMFIYNIESNELENPNYILIQSWNETLNKWDNSKLYKVNGDVKKFYDKISSKTIEVSVEDDKYIYSTSNSNEWVLQNTEKQDDTFKKYLRKDDFEKLIKDKKAIIKII